MTSSFWSRNLKTHKTTRISIKIQEIFRVDRFNVPISSDMCVYVYIFHRYKYIKTGNKKSLFSFYIILLGHIQKFLGNMWKVTLCNYIIFKYILHMKHIVRKMKLFFKGFSYPALLTIKGQRCNFLIRGTVLKRKDCLIYENNLLPFHNIISFLHSHKRYRYYVRIYFNVLIDGFKRNK